MVAPRASSVEGGTSALFPVFALFRVCIFALLRACLLLPPFGGWCPPACLVRSGGPIVSFPPWPSSARGMHLCRDAVTWACACPGGGRVTWRDPALALSTPPGVDAT